MFSRKYLRENKSEKHWQGQEKSSEGKWLGGTTDGMGIWCQWKKKLRERPGVALPPGETMIPDSASPPSPKLTAAWQIKTII